MSNNTLGVANLATLGYDVNGQVSDVNFQTTTGSALANDHFAYDGDLRPVSALATWQSGSGATGTIFSQGRTYDPVGNVTSVSTTLAAVPGQSGSGGSETQNFCYDEENRLVWAGNSGTQPAAGIGTCGNATLATGLNGAGYSTNYAYTHLGQLWQGPLNGTGTAYQYLYCDSTHPHELTGLYPVGTSCSNLTGAVYTSSYDNWGNVTNRTYNSTNATLSYDILDELVQWNAGATSQEWYAYDSGGNRIIRRSTTGSGTSLTVYAFGLEEHVYSSSGTPQSNIYYYSLGGRIVGELQGSTTQFFLTDPLGSVLTTFNATAGSATVQGNQVYGPYGNSRYSQGAMGTNKGFTGQYADATGLDYYNARYYDPVVGRFLSADTVQGNMQGMDPYDYVGGNPETLNDPTGKMYAPMVITGTNDWRVKQDAPRVAHGVANGHQPPVGGYAQNQSVPKLLYLFLFDNKGFMRFAATGGAAHFEQVMSALRAEAKSYYDELIQDINWNSGNTDLLDLQLTLLHIFIPVGGADPLINPAAFQRDGGAADDVGGSDSATNALEANTEEGLPKDLKEEVDAGCSFTSGTQVATGQGKQAIGTLQVGDKVWAYNPKTGKMELQPILHVWINHDNDLVDLTITTLPHPPAAPASKGKSEVIHTNQKHPFLTIEKGFLPVGQIKVGMHVLQADGNIGLITDWKLVPGVQTMYNLEVAQDHTFAVGDGSWVVHNCGYQGGDTTPGGLAYTQYSAQRANKRGFTSDTIDNIVRNGGKTRKVEWLPDSNDPSILVKRWRYQDSRGNVVITNEYSDTIITVYGYHPNTGEGDYISK